ncbi:MAG: hypothetical protein ACRD3W_21605 [Terriglobales bacterium]
MTLSNNTGDINARAASAIVTARDTAAGVSDDPTVVSRVFYDRLNEELSPLPLAGDYGKALAVACAAASELSSILPRAVN